MLELHLLGELSLEVDGNRLEAPRSRRARSLLAWLALHPGGHSRSEVAGRFWPDVLEESARASLRGALTELRRSLGPAADSLVATRERVELVRDERVTVDAEEFERLAAGGELDRALELARGDLLAGLDDDWAHDAREQHRRRLADVLGRRAAQAEDDGDARGAVQWTRRQVATEPLSEEHHRQLIRRLWESGDRPAALAAFETLRERLRKELGMAPSAETRRLVEELRSGAAATEPEREPAAAAGPLARTAATPRPAVLSRLPLELVGREREVSRLHDALELARGEAHQLAMVAGDAGIGKTRLVTTFARQAFDAGAAVLYGRCEEEALVPYQPWVEALEQHARGSDPDALRSAVGAAGPELARLVPAIEQLLAPLPAPARDEPDTERYRLFGAVATFLANLAADRPLVVVLDDLHWADKGTLLLLRHVERSLVAAPVLTIGTYRDTEIVPGHPLADTLAGLRRGVGGVESVQLDGLDDEAVAALVSRRRGSADATFARTLREETAGNPFFIEEVLRNTPEQTGTSQLAVPEGVKHVVARRLGGLSDAARTVLTAASVIGRDFDLALLGDVTGLAPDAIVDALEGAARANLISELPDTVGRWTFFHALTRAALYDDLSRTRRAQLHLRIGEALERRATPGDATQLAELAHHFNEAAGLGAAERAMEYSEGAAAHAAGQLAFEDAARYYRRALSALDQIPDTEPAQRVELLLALGEAETSAGETHEARAAFAAAADAARDEDDGEQLARAALGLAGPNWQAFGEVDSAAVALLEEALERLPKADGQTRALVLARLSSALYFDDARHRVRALTQEGMSMARRLGSRGALSAALEAGLWASWTPDGIHERLEVAGELRALGEAAGSEEAVASACRWRVVALLESGCIEAAISEIEAHAAVATRLGQDYELMYTTIFATMRALYEGRWEDALAGVSSVAGIEQRRAGADARQFAGVHALTLAFERGGLEHLEKPVEEFATRYPRVPAWRAPMPLVQIDAGRPDAARALLSEMARDSFAALPRDANWIPGMAWLALATVDLGEREHARAIYDLLLPYDGRAVVLGAGGAVWGPVAYYLGSLAATAGAEREAARHLEEAVEFARASGSTSWENRARAALGGVGAAAPGPGA